MLAQPIRTEQSYIDQLPRITDEEIDFVIRQNPKLNYQGYVGERDEATLCGLETPKLLKESRQQLLDWKQHSTKLRTQVRLCLDWLEYMAPTSRTNKNHTSYGYKHAVERYVRQQTAHLASFDNYIPNTAFIIAAIFAGYQPQGTGNPYFRLSEKHYKAHQKAYDY
jgi:hypothetical protein